MMDQKRRRHFCVFPMAELKERHSSPATEYLIRSVGGSSSLQLSNFARNCEPHGTGRSVRKMTCSRNRVSANRNSRMATNSARSDVPSTASCITMIFVRNGRNVVRNLSSPIHNPHKIAFRINSWLSFEFEPKEVWICETSSWQTLPSDWLQIQFKSVSTSDGKFDMDIASLDRKTIFLQSNCVMWRNITAKRRNLISSTSLIFSISLVTDAGIEYGIKNVILMIRSFWADNSASPRRRQLIEEGHWCRSQSPSYR
jgi:hypothetical protein